MFLTTGQPLNISLDGVIMENVADKAEKKSKFWFLTIFLILSAWICLILQIMIVLMVLDHLTSSNYLTCGQNYAKCRQLCRKKELRSLFFVYFSILRPWIFLILLIMIPIIVVAQIRLEMKKLEQWWNCQDLKKRRSLCQKLFRWWD